MADSPFNIAARQRWPGYDVRGNGEWALVCPIVKLITLYDLALLAKVDAEQPHSNWGCAASHKLVRIKPAPVRQPVWESRIWED